MARDILVVAVGGARKTQLVYEANLNFEIIKKYLGELVARGLIEKQGPKFHTTDNGQDFIKWMAGLDNWFNGPQGVLLVG